MRTYQLNICYKNLLLKYILSDHIQQNSFKNNMLHIIFIQQKIFYKSMFNIICVGRH